LSPWLSNFLVKRKEAPLPPAPQTGFLALVGLGNPGDQYKATRHNIGYQFLDYLAQSQKLTWKKEKRYESESATLELAGQKLLLLKPQTFMNNSGKSVSSLMRYQRWPASSLIVAHDEINLPFGTLKLSNQGTAGGHNGINDIFQHGARDILRFRLGIGQKQHKHMELTDHVLGKFSSEESLTLLTRLGEWEQALGLILSQGAVQAMNLINRKEKNHELN
jgi:PTH1 family peptidyl-tRNA hydrolase